MVHPAIIPSATDVAVATMENVVAAETAGGHGHLADHGIHLALTADAKIY